MSTPERVCFVMRVRPEAMEEYRRRHAEVWPEMLDALRRTGWRNYSLFAAGDGTVIGYVETDDFQAALDGMQGEPVNARWQTEMTPMFALQSAPDTTLERLEEVFHLD
ncbi:MAG TPA: L-rhamnose mutarotase [Solirubrobacteraceae bacterium]|jgi:L-rhamnose mutarotase|nr:L-rhamnose mutarotase [Solirubrobacteraceae bacterium]